MKILQSKKFIRIHFVLLAMLLVGAGWLFRPGRTVNAQLTDQSFLVPETWVHDFGGLQGWAPEYPRMMANVNADKSQDVVGFGIDGVWLSTSTGTNFKNPAFVLKDFGFASGWRTNLHVRTMGDITGDEMEDIVGFGADGVYRAVSKGDGFEPPKLVVSDFGYNQGWRNDKHVRLLADVNGDGRKDIVGFGNLGVWISMSMSPVGDFSEPFLAVGDFGYDQGWRNDKHVRTMADVNGDTMQDIVGFGNDGVWVSYSSGWGFQAPQFVLAEFALNAGGWQVAKHPRIMADVNNDQKDDIVGFGWAGVWISYSNGNGFDPQKFAVADFGYNQGWRTGRDPVFDSNGHAHTGCNPDQCPDGANPRFVVDLNGDGYRDIVGFGTESIYRALGGPNGFGTTRGMLRALVTASGFPWHSNDDVVPTFYPRTAADVNGDGMTDLVAFDHDDVKVVVSTDQPPPNGPKAPTNAKVIAATPTSLTLKWQDNSDDERRFLIYYDENPSTGNTELFVSPENSTTAVIQGLTPETGYCFKVHAENIFGVSAGAFACGKTEAEPEPMPTPTPSPSGIKEIQVFNCNLDNHSVYIWTFDVTLGMWKNHGKLDAISKEGSCSTIGVTPFTVPLQQGHWFRYVAVDPALSGCGVNDPTNVFCQRSTYPNAWFGDPNGPVLINTVN
ncbi:MAG TPA: fibronectin type III domain-containing protein [Pyrinomonadaceae bacterium]|nr:fibronectin type III domain-containing protein [Pyrinomonadaceae bacterium]